MGEKTREEEFVSSAQSWWFVERKEDSAQNWVRCEGADCRGKGVGGPTWDLLCIATTRRGRARSQYQWIDRSGGAILLDASRKRME